VNVIVIVSIDLESSYIENCCQCESINVASLCCTIDCVDFTDLNLYCIKGALALFVLVSFSGYVC